MTNSERRVSLVQRALDPPGEALPDWEIFARVGRALGHREAFPWRTAAAVHAEYVQTHRGPAVRPDRHLAHAAAARRADPVAVPVARPPRHGAAVRVAALRHADGRARLAPTPHTAPADPVTPDFPLVADHRPRRAAVAHDDPHGQVAVAAGAPSRTRSSSCTPTTPSACRRREGARALAPRLGRAAAARSATPCRRGVALRAVPLGRAAPRGRRGRAEQRDLARRSTRSPAAGAEGLRGAASSRSGPPVAASGGRHARDRRRGHGRHGRRRGGARPRARAGR